MVARSVFPRHGMVARGMFELGGENKCFMGPLGDRPVVQRIGVLISRERFVTRAKFGFSPQCLFGHGNME
jgi:hypothetical protein